MNKKRWNVFFYCSVFSLSLLFCINALANGELSDATANATAERPFSSGETLHYKLSYRGLLTSMIWADIADIKMTFLANKPTPNHHNGHQFVLQLSTANYTKAEIIHPVRYTYTTTLDESLQRTLLVEETDTGANNSHYFLWLDWHTSETQLFKKREKEQITSGFLGLDSAMVWEKDGERAIPEFLSHFPLIENDQTYLIHKESGDKIKNSSILDPLSMIYTLRSLNFDTEEFDTIIEIPIAVSDDIRLYRIERTGIEEIKVGGENHQTTRYKIHTDEKKDNSYYIWLSNDELKIPLRLAMKAPLGRLEVDLVKVTRIDNWGVQKVVQIGHEM